MKSLFAFVLTCLLTSIAFATPPASTAASTAASASGCYADEPAVVTVTGVLIEKDKAGRDSSSGGKEIDGYFVLRFKPPICTVGYTDADMDKTGYYDVPQANVRDMQMVFLGDSVKLYEILRPRIGKKVQCTGQLFDAQTAGHRTPVLIQIMRKEDCRSAPESAG